MTAPVPPPLRPLSLGEVLDVSFGLYRSMFFSLVVVAVAVHILPTLIGIYLETSGQMFSLWPLTIGYLFLVAILSSLGVAATTEIVSEAYLGRRISAAVALTRAVPLLLRLIVISLLTWLLVGIGFILLLVPGIILLSGLLLSSVAMVVERPRRATAAMARSWELTLGFRGKVFGALLLAFLLLMVPVITIAAIWGTLEPGRVSGSVMAEVITAVIQVLIYPYVYTVFTLLYYDLRIRKEGFDLELLAAQSLPA